MSDEAAPPEGNALPVCPHCGEDHPPSRLKCPNTDLDLPLAGRILHDKFRFTHLLGKGGMASVWAAVNTLVDRPVAIKIIRPEAGRDQDTVARFRAEAKAAGRVAHANVCQILDFGMGPVGPYIVMEHLRGESLGQYIRREGPLDAAVTAGIVRQALVGLEAAHRHGIIHRDLKPENLFLHQPEGSAPLVKIMDFGVSKLTDGSSGVHTEHGALLGTPEYMSPEQFKGAASADVRTDIWAMGAIIYKALTGHAAFGGPTVAATLLNVTTEEPTPIAEHVRGTPPELIAIVERCLHKDPDARFQSAAQLADELEAFDLNTLATVVVTETAAAKPDDAIVAPMRAGESPPEPPASSAEAEAGPVVESGPPTYEDSETVVREVSATDLPKRSRSRWLPWLGVAAVAAGGLLAFNAGWFSSTDSEATEGAGVTTPATANPTTTPTEPIATAPASTGGSETSDEEPSVQASTSTDSSGTTSSAASPDELILEDDDTTTNGDSSTGVDDDAGDDDDDGSVPTVDAKDPSAEPDAPPPTPPGTIRVGRYLTLKKPGPTGDHNEARAYCRSLGEQSFVGVPGWKLASPTVAKKVSKDIKKGRYWTNALWRGNAIVLLAPSKKTDSRAANRSGPRALCVAKWP